jgi:hypothetical protein
VQQRRPSRRPTSVSTSVPAPIEGWDAISSLADMKASRAIVLENFFPEPGQVRLRKGYSQHATGMTGVVESLMAWNGGSSSKMFAAANNSIYEVTSSGAVGAAAVSGLTNNRWQHVNFGAGGGGYLILANGEDSVRAYSGSAWSTPAITNVTASTLVHVMAHKKRLYFIKKNTMSVWYLGTGAISGAATEFPLESVFRRGGHLLTFGSWSIDGGNGLDDLAVFITSEGEVAIYQGTDPGASDWQIVGRWDIGAPIGRRSLLKVGGDLGAVTIDGFVPLSAVLNTDRAAVEKISLSNRIKNAANSAARLYKDNFGWQAIGYPRGNWALFNIPISEGTTQHQYVMNVLTGAWCKFTGMNANCWELLNDMLYFGGNDGKVYLADDGFDDDGAAREGNIKTAFNYFGKPGQQKQFKLVRPVITTDAAIAPAVELNVNFEDRYPTAVPTAAASSGPFWDEEYWDSVEWGDAADITLQWIGVVGIGLCAALRLRVASAAADVAVSAFDVIYEPGAVFG